MPTTILDNETYPEALQRRYAEKTKAEKQAEIIRMAEKACAPHQILNTDLVFLERFFNLAFAAAAANEREKLEDFYPAYITYTDEELEEAKASLLKAKSLDERFAFIWETIYDHGNGKHLGALSRAQREVAWFYLQQIQDVCKAIEAAVLAEREACAEVCEDEIKSYMSKQYTTDPLGGYRERFAAEQCAAAIRNRSNT